MKPKMEEFEQIEEEEQEEVFEDENPPDDDDDDDDKTSFRGSDDSSGEADIPLPFAEYQTVAAGKRLDFKLKQQ